MLTVPEIHRNTGFPGLALAVVRARFESKGDANLGVGTREGGWVTHVSITITRLSGNIAGAARSRYTLSEPS